MDRLEQMEAFVRVADARSFTAAARAWGVSKAAVSKYVAALEEHLGVGLLERTTRTVRLTPAGEAYRVRCRDLLDELSAMEGELRSDHQQPSGLLRVSAPPGFMSRFGDQLTTGFLDRYPDVRMDLRLTHRMVDLIEEGVDVAIRVTAPADSSLVARRLADASVIAVASPAYLKANGRPRRPADLARHACLVDTNFRDGDRWPFHTTGRREVVRVTGPVRADSPTVLRDLAVQGRGIALISRFIVAPELSSGCLVEVLRGKVDLHWGIHAVYPRRRYLAGRTRAFIEHLAEVVG